jgi:hypothetical protein
MTLPSGLGMTRTPPPPPTESGTGMKTPSMGTRPSSRCEEKEDAEGMGVGGGAAGHEQEEEGGEEQVVVVEAVPGISPASPVFGEVGLLQGNRAG